VVNTEVIQIYLLTTGVNELILMVLHSVCRFVGYLTTVCQLRWVLIWNQMEGDHVVTN